MPEFVTNEQVVQAARRNLRQSTWDYLIGASESETTMRRNRLAFDRWAFRPRVLVDVSKLDPSGSLLGHHLRIPVILAPLGGLHLFTPGGNATAAEVAAAFDTMQVVSSASEPDIEGVAVASDAPKVYQLYIRGDMNWTAERVARIKAAGYTGFCLTVDTAVPSRRERAMLSGHYQGSRATAGNWPATVTWETLDRIKELVGLPLYVKGIATPEDADIAVKHGVGAVWVSNHGGRQLDHGLGTIDVLPEIVQAVAGRAAIIVDGGVQRGSDVIKAIALGADAVAIGKLQALGVAADGKAGLIRVLEILEAEMLVAMGLLGVSRLGELGPQYLARAEAVTPPHEMSGWVNLPRGGGNPEGRIL